MESEFIKQLRGTSSKKNLLYLASGSSNIDYDLPNFDNIVLVDKCFKKYAKVNNSWTVPLECTDAVLLFIQHNIKFDCVVIINEGLSEGGGLFPLHQDWFLGLLMLIMNKEYIHIGGLPSYYTAAGYFHTKNHFLDLPADVKSLDKENNDYLNPELFSRNPAKVYRIKKKINSHQIKLGRINCNIMHKSIWENIDISDLVITYNFKPFFSKLNNFFGSKLKTINSIWSREVCSDFNSFQKVLKYCNKNKINSVGFTPWNNGDYTETINTIQDWDFPYPKSINFYHLNKNDFKAFKYLN